MVEYNNFKIIGVKPLKGCNPRILKNLKEDQPYFFYNCFKWVNNNVAIVDSGLPEGFFSPGINIHAIVGKNGSGKSSLLDIMFRIINNLAFAVLYNDMRPAAEELSYAKNINAELFYIKGVSNIYTLTVENNIIIWKSTQKELLIVNLDELILSKGSRGFNSVIQKEILSELFYTIVTNYSHYAYNSIELAHESPKNKCWIDGLFHKNDGYLTPIVLNPYRIEGNININTENDLTRTRLISLFIQSLIQNKNEFDSKYDFHSLFLNFTVQLTNSKLKNIENKWNKYWDAGWAKYPNNGNKIEFTTLTDLIIKIWNNKHSFFKKDKQKESKEYSYAIKYLAYKTLKIAENYQTYKDYNINNLVLLGDLRSIETFISRFVNILDYDHSHITLKIRQTINFLKYEHYSISKKNIPKELTLSIIKDKIKEKSFVSQEEITLAQIMNFLPPPIFTTSFYLSFLTEKNRTKKVEISDISSGERQLLYSISSILYHLSNLDSIEENDIEINEKRVSYNCANLVMEEVELYYHPDYQKKYINNLIHNIELLQLQHIVNINICIVTHSPFVLSDIPKTNILFLENGEPSFKTPKNDTFGANIYDLLKESFFLNENAIGDFVNKKIVELLEDLKNPDKTKLELKPIIDLIGEPLIHNYLTEKNELKNV